ncbi:MAG: hypothetical protein KAI40_04825 [Desulfobacterales bacterium]|nr:hypothetical protein [Desulfobacterales bacterium]
METIVFKQTKSIGYLTLNRPNQYNAFDEAMSLGFASRIVTKDKMLETATELAKIMASKNPLGLRKYCQSL